MLLRPTVPIVSLSLFLLLFLFIAFPSADGFGVERAVREKRGWPWDWIGKQACKTAANCKCKDGKSWAKCVKSEGYAASNCCDKNYVWACCGKKPKH
ncbi:hypothetical protein niasHS_015012 [Heterodera schachtii]|uniref:Uncharacterized protein n=1 Tax=Heterodera schachtii TaxID=97005 RepID=A0ABD2I1V2_HETSC